MKSYSAEYTISVYEENSKICIKEFHQTFDGYNSLETVKDDVDSRIHSLMRKNGINNASLHLEMVISDPDGEYCDSDTIELRYADGTVIFEP